jgi:ATP-binding cassette, subfamily B (MDR/TAP), member 1
LDSTSEKIVQEALDNLLKMKKRTTIIIAHRLSTIRDADKIVVLENGVVVEQGTHDSLLSSDTSLYAALVNMQLTSMEETSAEPHDEIPTQAQIAQALAVPSTRKYSIQIASPELEDIESGSAGIKNKQTHTNYKEISGKDEEELQAMMKTKVGKAIIDTEAEVDKKTSSIAWIWALSAPERPYLVAGLFGSVLLGASFPILGYLLAAMIGIFFNPDPKDMLRKAAYYAYIFLGVAGSQLLGIFLGQYCFGVITEKLARRVREKSFLKMLQMEVTWFDQPENTAGTLAQQLATDCMMVKALTGERASTSCSQLVTFAVAFAVAFYQSWEMTLVMVGLFPVIGAAFALQHKFVTSAAGASMTATNEAGSVASQTLLNIRTINAFGLEMISAAAFEKHLVEPLKQVIKKGTVTGFGMGFSQLVILSGAGLAYYTGGQLVLLGRATFTEVISVILVIMLGAIGLGQFAADASDKAEALTAAKKIQKLWQQTTKITAMSDEGEIPTAIKGEVVLRDVCFAYPMRPDHDVYNKMNLTIEAGQTVALVGPSGCGKSTAVALIERFYDPSAGAVLLDGKDIKTLRLSWLRQQIGLVSQEPVLFIGSIADNIAYGKEDATMEEIEAAARMANAHDFISAFPDAYKTQVGEKGVQLSGGQKQRVAIARAIIRDPKILILDEATSALDSASEQVVQAALDNLLVAKKRTTIVIAHRLSTIKKADKIVVFSDGVVVEQGTHDALLLDPNGAYSALVRNSQRSVADPERATI